MEQMPLSSGGRLFIAAVIAFSMFLLFIALEIGRKNSLSAKILFVINSGVILLPVVYMKMTNTYDAMAAFLSYLIAALYLLIALIDLIFFALEKLVALIFFVLEKLLRDRDS